MIKIGVTGGIGSGKTTVCKIFEVLNIAVFYADDAARSVMDTDIQLIEALKAEFGDKIYSEEGVLDRKALAAIVFNNIPALEKLNSLVHPAAIQAFVDWKIGRASCRERVGVGGRGRGGTSSRRRACRS